jgi:hypothetical protein
MNLREQKEISSILSLFNRQISRIIKVIETVEKDNIDLECIKRVLRIARDEKPTFVIESCIDKFWQNREKIIQKDREFFIKNKFDKFIKDDENKEWIEGIITLIKQKQSELDDDEITYLWECINTMLQCIIKYRIVMKDYAL